MGEISDKRRKKYVDLPLGKSKTCLIHGLRNSSVKCKVLGEFGDKYAKGKTNKDRVIHPVPRNKFNRQQGNNAIVNNTVDEILLHDTPTVSAVKEAPKFWEYGYD